MLPDHVASIWERMLMRLKIDKDYENYLKDYGDYNSDYHDYNYLYNWL